MKRERMDTSVFRVTATRTFVAEKRENTQRGSSDCCWRSAEIRGKRRRIYLPSPLRLRKYRELRVIITSADCISDWPPRRAHGESPNVVITNDYRTCIIKIMDEQFCCCITRDWFFKEKLDSNWLGFPIYLKASRIKTLYRYSLIKNRYKVPLLTNLYRINLYHL